ncbi:nitroreductase family protein [Marinobacter salicampi]|uniref:nitroreductase family protein n=1 Tax=Marinobacter salicampi TaxID=435907 RepID=UPI001408E34C|nr:nitroreductase family protein [Marinobacter salicampi]
MNPVLEAILNRSSEPRLSSPAPDSSQLEDILACAARAPDHALLRPWRYLVIEGAGLEALGELFVEAADDPDDPLEGSREKLLKTASRAPMIIVGICSPKQHSKVPFVEQVMSSAVGLGYVLLALESAGFGAVWRTGALAYHPVVHRGLGLGEGEQISGFLYVGSVVSEKSAVPRPDTSTFVSRWP